jgi:murein hydrolase activator
MQAWRGIMHVGVLVGGVLLAGEAVGQSEREQLETIQRQLQEKQRAAAQISGKERTLLGELRAIEARVKEAQHKLEEYRGQLADNEAELKRAEENIAAMRAEQSDKTAMLSTRLRALYKMGDLGYLGPLLSLSSHADTHQQLLYLHNLAAQDKALLTASEAHIQAILGEHDRLNQRKQAILEAQRQIEQHSAEVLAQQKQKTALLASIQNDKQQNQQFIEELQRSAARLDTMIQKFDSPAPAASKATTAPGERVNIPTDADKVVQAYNEVFRSNKGKLLWPVQGQILTKYGRIQIGDTYTQYKGVDIRADIGTPFYAVFKGTVKFADRFDGYGNLIILDHGGNFFTLYAHASELLVKTGDVVETRQTIGKVGDTDSIKGPYLYFEIRANGKPEDPQTWLAKL